MPQKQAAFKIRGMQRDVSESAFNAEYAFENMNLRITAENGNTFYSLSNEKGNKPVAIEWDESVSNFSGTPLGKAVINHSLVLFFHNEDEDRNGDSYNPDRIYKLWYEDDTMKGCLLYGGDIGLSLEHPIETTVNYESEDIQKVYWTDGINQPRVINIADTSSTSRKLDFLTEFSRNGSSFSVEKQNNGSGVFNSGTIQYFVTYYEKYGQETNIVWSSPVMYISPYERGGTADETCTCSFRIEMNDTDSSFDYVRIYSLRRTSESGTPQAYIVADLKNSGNSITFTDNGIDQTSIDPTILMYVGGMEIHAGTLEQKDGTLFLGDLTLAEDLIDDSDIETIQEAFKENESMLYFTTRTAGSFSTKSMYSYDSQLNSPASEVKTFKGGEWYRIGMQFMSSKGQWSRVVYLKDIQNNVYPKYDESSGEYEVAQLVFKGSEAFWEAVPSGIEYCRLVYAEMNSADRTVLAQGAVCPTLFNYRQRMNGTPFSIPSWFMRPDNDTNYNNDHLQNVQGDRLDSSLEIEGFCVKESSADETVNTNPEYVEYAYTLKDKTSGNDEVIPASIVFTVYVNVHKTMLYWGQSGKIKYKVTDSDQHTIKETDYTSFKFRNRTRSLYDDLLNYMKSAGYGKYTNLVTESQITDTATVVGSLSTTGFTYTAFMNVIGDGKSTYAGYFDVTVSIDDDYISAVSASQNFFVDRSILTLNSPDLEDMKDRINGSNVKFRIVGTAPITSSTSAYNITAENITGILSDGGKQEDYSFDMVGTSGTGLKTFPLWYDNSWNLDKNKTEEDESDDVWYLGNSPTIYPVYPWQSSGSLNGHPDNLREGVAVDKSSVLKTKKMANMRISAYTDYYTKGSTHVDWTPEITYPKVCFSDSIEYKRLVEGEHEYMYQNNYDFTLIHTSKYTKFNIGTASYDMSKDEAEQNMMAAQTYTDGTNVIDYPYSTKPVRIKYKCTPHAVFKLEDVIYDGTTYHNILPENIYNDSSVSVNVVWDSDAYHIINERMSSSDSSWHDIFGSTSPSLPFIWIGEFYIDKPDSFMGGISSSALQLNKWIPVSDIANVGDENIYSNEGDTYYQRWDCLKTYPYTEEDENSVIDITSFMVETRENIDGRCDSNRGTSSILYARPTNWNIMNSAYTQSNNFLTYSVLDEKFDLNAYRNQITWTKTKSNSEDIDTWTNLTLSSVLELDGDKGAVTRLMKWNNALLAFQERGISEIQYNNLTALATSEGVPIEIANSGKVNGKNYLSSTVGCSNKWSIAEGRNAIYFIDDYSKAMYRFNGQLQNLSESKGFYHWIHENAKGVNDIWNPEDFGNFTTQFDASTGDVYFIDSDECLAFNESLDEFTSFYSYEHVPYIANLDNRSLAVSDAKIDSDDSNIYRLWEQHAGDYNYYFNKYHEFYTIVIVNQDMQQDKVFNNVEFRSDTWCSDGILKDTTFDHLYAWDEYQYGVSRLTSSPGHPSSLKRKFRVWRANVPRDDRNGRDRIRNTWAYVKLSMENPNTNRTVLHDLLVDYFI